jgi:hypothetical protein
MWQVQLEAFFLVQNACTAFLSKLVSMLELSPPLPILLLLRVAGLSGLNTIIVHDDVAILISPLNCFYWYLLAFLHSKRENMSTNWYPSVSIGYNIANMQSEHNVPFLNPCLVFDVIDSAAGGSRFLVRSHKSCIKTVRFIPHYIFRPLCGHHHA